MKKTLIKIFVIFNLLPFAVFAQHTLPDTIHRNEILCGKCFLQELQQNEFGSHFLSEYRNYLPYRGILNDLEKKIYGCRISIVLGTWCSDSKEQVPRFVKILDELQYKTSCLEIICVDKLKTAGNLDISDLKIERVPTFIFYIDEEEIGRITETPHLTLEQDTYHILFSE